MRKIFIFSLILFFYFYAKAGAEDVISLDAPVQFYLVEKVVNAQSENVMSSLKIKNLFVKQLRIAGFHVLDDLESPFVSRQMAHYGLSHSSKVQSSGIGYVHLLLADDDTVRYVSDSGQTVILKSDLKKIDWIFEKKKALEMADKAGAKYAFAIEVTTELVYQDGSPKPVYNVSLDATLYQADDGKVSFHDRESMVKLASTVSEANWGACQFLSRKLVEVLQDEKNVKLKNN